MSTKAIGNKKPDRPSVSTLYDWTHRFKNFSPHTLKLMLWLALATFSLSMFLELSYLIHGIDSNSMIQQIDNRILLWAETLRSPILNIMMLDVTALGGLAFTVIFGFTSVVLFILARDPGAAVHFIITATGGYALSIFTKGLIARPRPDIIPKLIQVSGFSYPSGHAITISAVYLTLAILAGRHFKKTYERMVLFMLAVFLITIVCFSRIYIGVHYPSDILSGAFLGATWALALAALFAKVHWKKHSRTHL